MSDVKKKLPIGIEDFEKMYYDDFYYIDKTGLIKELMENWAEVNLFTRPRRFGKSLNMSMLKKFFEMGTDKSIFEGLEITKEKQLCEEYMGQFPVISVSMKEMNAGSYEMACKMAVQVIGGEARRFQYLLESKKLTDYDKDAYRNLLKTDMDEAILCSSLKLLSELLCKHHGKKVILLIDEYDVPLAKAFHQGYYEQMVLFVRNMFGQVLKTNENLQMAVLTGCMRISKESIFTGLNNLKVLSIADVRFDEYFGFTDQEVRDLLSYYGLSHKYQEIKDWYDGYQFGNVEVYCPWDVLNYCDLLRADPEAQPQNYWSNTSSNEVVKRFIEQSDNGRTRLEIEHLVAGEVIHKTIHQELTYQDMYQSIENLWSVLFTTGYLTQRGRVNGDEFQLAIPNMEIRKIFTTQIMEYFKEGVRKNGKLLQEFTKALQHGNAEEVEKQFGAYLKKTISIRDTFVKRQLKENFYHGILLGILGFQDQWAVFSNRESGDGYNDILVEIEDEELGIIMEVKYAQDGDLEAGCADALAQMEQKSYEEVLYQDGMEKILKYGIACYKKRCKVVLDEKNSNYRG